jgi:hypothetical protein
MVLGMGACAGSFSGVASVTATSGHEDCDVTDGSDGRLSAAVLFPVGNGKVWDRLGDTRGFWGEVIPPTSSSFTQVLAIGGGRFVRYDGPSILGVAFNDCCVGFAASSGIFPWFSVVEISASSFLLVFPLGTLCPSSAFKSASTNLFFEELNGN